MQEEALNPSLISTVETPSASQSASNDKRLRRIQRLMWPTSIGVALSIPAVLIVPIWPRLAFVSAIVLLLTTVGIYLLTSWVQRSLIIPDENGKLPPWWETRNVKSRRLYIRHAMATCSYLYFMGALFIVGQWWQSTRDWDSLRWGFGWLIGGIVAYTLFALLWGRVGSKVDLFMDRTLGSVIIGAIGITFFALNFTVIPDQLSKLKVGSAAPWAEQWSLVQQEIATKYPQAALTGLSARPEYDAPKTCDATLHTTFFFRQNDDKYIDATLRDSNPEASLQIGDIDYASSTANSYTNEDLAKLKALYSTLLISPRDAFLKAKASLEHDRPGSNACGLRTITLYLKDPRKIADATLEKLGRSTVWYVSLSDTGSDHVDVQYWIDAQTGDVLLRENK